MCTAFCFSRNIFAWINFSTNIWIINGENITQEDLQIANNIVLQKFKNIYGDDFNLDDLDESIQLEALKQELINQKVLLSKARKLGFMNKETEKQAKKSIISKSCLSCRWSF